MTQYILKDVIVAEIKELIRANELCLSDPETDEVTFQIKTNIYNVLNDLLHFIDTLEVIVPYEHLIQYPSREKLRNSMMSNMLPT